MNFNQKIHVVEVQIRTLRHSTNSSSVVLTCEQLLWARRGQQLLLSCAQKSLPADSYLVEYSYLSGVLYAVIFGRLRPIVGLASAFQKNLAHMCCGQVPVPAAATTGSSTIGMLIHRGPPSCLQPEPLKAPSFPPMSSARRSGSASQAAVMQNPVLSSPQAQAPAVGLACCASGLMQIWFQGLADSNQKSMITVKFSGSSPVP